MPSAKITTDHDEIRQWVEERGGKPACVRGTGAKNDPGILRIEFPDYNPDAEEKLHPMAWDDWFEALEENGLAFLRQEESGGEKSYFNKLVRRDEASARTGGGSHRSSRAHPAR